MKLLGKYEMYRILKLFVFNVDLDDIDNSLYKSYSDLESIELFSVDGIYRYKMFNYGSFLTLNYYLYNDDFDCYEMFDRLAYRRVDGGFFIIPEL